MWKRIKALRVLLPQGLSWRKMLWTSVVMGLLVASFCFGRFWANPATAQQTDYPIKNVPLLSPIKMEDPGRPVAYVYNNVPITRQDLGEYLIARFGPERLEFLVNRKIVEMACQSKGIIVTEAEIEAQLVEDLKNMGISKLDDFVNVVLKRFGKSLYEYKEDVIRPKLALNKFCRGKVQVTERDIKNAFEAKYGPKVVCRMIVFPKEQSDRDLQKIWKEVKDSESAFLEYARKQFIQELGANGGKVPPIHKHFGDERVEKEAFSLKVGEVSSLLPMPDGTTVILKCDAHLPPNKNHRIEDEWTQLHQEVFERKLAEEVPKVFQTLRKEADPKIFLKREQANQQAKVRINQVLHKAALERAKAEIPPPLPPGAGGTSKGPDVPSEAEASSKVPALPSGAGAASKVPALPPGAGAPTKTPDIPPLEELKKLDLK